MEYRKEISLKNGASCLLRNGEEKDGLAVWAVFNQTHGETDYLLSYPEENSKNPEQEARFLQEKTESPDEIEIVAEIGGEIVGSAGIEKVGWKEKVRRRANLGISVEKAWWGLGVGRALMEACVACAKKAGYAQIELDVVAENERAVSLYKSVGFQEYGRNPKGFFSRVSGWQELVLMRLDLEENERGKEKP